MPAESPRLIGMFWDGWLLQPFRFARHQFILQGPRKRTVAFL
jgi:hypothetical protein